MEGKNEGRVNVVACITNMREQRMKMVETSEQYKFIFQVLAYAQNFDCLPIPIEDLNDWCDDVYIERQYQELNLSLQMKSKGQIYSYRAKNKSYKGKNRRIADIQDNENRVYLYLNSCYEDPDYINAFFINV